MWKFLINMYITEPRAKHKGRFGMLWYLIILSGGLTLLQINTILYPTPELSELGYIKGKLVEIVDGTGHRYPFVSATLLTINNKRVKVGVSTSKRDALLYQQYIGSPIQIWYRWNGTEYYASQVILDSQIVRVYSQERQFKAHLFSLIPLYLFLLLFFYALCKPWFVLIIRKLKERKHIL